MAEKLMKKCPVNVFDIEDIGNGNVNHFIYKISLYASDYIPMVHMLFNQSLTYSVLEILVFFNCLWHSVPIFFIYELAAAGRKRATVARPRACTLCRECIREDGWEKYVALRRVKDHFICKYVIQISYLVQSFLLVMYSMRLFTWKHIIGLWFASFFVCIMLSFSRLISGCIGMMKLPSLGSSKCIY